MEQERTKQMDTRPGKVEEKKRVTKKESDGDKDEERKKVQRGRQRQ